MVERQPKKNKEHETLHTLCKSRLISRIASFLSLIITSFTSISPFYIRKKKSFKKKKESFHMKKI